MSSNDPLDLRGQEQASDDARRRERLARQSEDDDLKWLMGSKRGRRIVWRLLDRAGVFRSSFNTNAMQMSFAEGGRNEGLRILAQVHTLCPELYPVMLKEATNDRPSDNGSHKDH
jgi:hypothetical protein